METRKFQKAFPRLADTPTGMVHVVKRGPLTGSVFASGKLSLVIVNGSQLWFVDTAVAYRVFAVVHPETSAIRGFIIGGVAAMFSEYLDYLTNVKSGVPISGLTDFALSGQVSEDELPVLASMTTDFSVLVARFAEHTAEVIEHTVDRPSIIQLPKFYNHVITYDVIGETDVAFPEAWPRFNARR